MINENGSKKSFKIYIPYDGYIAFSYRRYINYQVTVYRSRLINPPTAFYSSNNTLIFDNQYIDSYLRFSDVSLNTSKSYVVDVLLNNNYKYLKIKITNCDMYSAGIALFKSSTINEDNLIYKILSSPNESYQYVKVPDECKYITLSHFKNSSDIEIQYTLETICAENIINNSDSNYINIIDKANVVANKWIRYTTGKLENTGWYIKVYYLNTEGLSIVKAYLFAKDTTSAAIAFYSSTEMNEDNYISSYSVQIKSGWNEYKINIPSDAKVVAFTQRIDYYEDNTEEPRIEVLSNEYLINKILYDDEETESIPYNDINLAKNVSLTNMINFLKPCYDHLFVNDTGSNVTIPHESLYHIRLSRKLGYNMIEANVYPTADSGIYIVNHLNGGKFGGWFHHVDGETDISEINCSTCSWEYIQENVRYNSQIPKYRTRPVRLEEFLNECIQQNIIPFLGRAQDSKVIEIADNIMGKDNYVAYGANRLYSPTATIYHWISKTTKQEILDYCNSIGRPFIYGMGNPNYFSDSELQDIVNTLHANGYWIGTSYVDANWYKYRNMGFDFNGTQTLINRIDNGNLYNFSSLFNFNNYTITNATEQDNALIFNSQGTIQPNVPDTVYNCCAIDIEMWFNGSITLSKIGTKSQQTFTSDSSFPVFVSIPIFNGSPKFTLTCDSGTVVYDLNYKASII